MIWRAFYVAAAGLVLAGIVHITIVLLVPKYSTRDAWNYLSSRADLYSFTRLDRQGSEAAIAEVDPFFSYGVCRFNLAESGVRMVGPVAPNFWSASVFDSEGEVVYSLNNRTAINNKLDMIIVSPLQTLALREAQPDEIETSVVIETGIASGYVVLRALQPDDSYAPDNQAFFEAIRCGRYDPGSS